MTRLMLLLTMILVAAPGKAGQGSYYTGNELLFACHNIKLEGINKPEDFAGVNLTEDEETRYISCLSYLAGVADAMLNVTACPPEEITAELLRRAFVQASLMFQAAPEVGEEPAAKMAMYAFSQAWPCGQEESQ